MDPFADLIQLLRPRATLWRRIDASGKWGISFRRRDDLLFCWVAHGECALLRPRTPQLHLAPGDFVLVRTSTPFSLASDRDAKPVDSETAFAAGKKALKLGAGREKPVRLYGGRFLFDTANEGLLTGLLPPVVRIAKTDSSARRIQSLLRMNAAESLHKRPGSDFVVPRLMDLILIEILRGPSMDSENRSIIRPSGLVAGLSDPVTAIALRTMHRNVGHNWTVAKLAHLAGVSRSSFAQRFREVVGSGPIEYLMEWRMAIARDELRKGEQSLSEIAFAIGFQSASAFSTAFRRAEGSSPKRFAAAVRGS